MLEAVKAHLFFSINFSNNSNALWIKKKIDRSSRSCSSYERSLLAQKSTFCTFKYRRVSIHSNLSFLLNVQRKQIQSEYINPIDFLQKQASLLLETLKKMSKLQDCPFQQGKIAGQKIVDENGVLFPMVLLPEDPNEDFNTLQSFLHTIKNNRDWINYHLKKVGALLFRGFPVITASDFNMVMEEFGWKEVSYCGGASRKRIEGRVHTANEAPLHQPIKFHHEMCLFEPFPAKIAFFCEIPPPDGGQTAILLSHKITERMEEKYPELVSKIEKEGLNDQLVFPAEDSPDYYLTGWQTLYETKDKKEAEKRAANSGVKLSNVRWNGEEMILDIGPTISIRKVDGNKRAWFNLLAFRDANQPRTVGDGSVIPKEAIESCIQIAEEECVDLKWEAGDVVVLDNRFIMHARRPSKPPRRILAAFCE